MKVLLCALAFLGCQKAPGAEPTASNLITFDSAADRMLGMADNGWIVSRGTNNEIQHQGDSLLWTSLAMGALDCERAVGPEKALLDMLAATGGKIWRHPTIPDEWSLDGAIGFYAGAFEHARRCPLTREEWAAALAGHKAAGQALPPFFPTLLDTVLASLDVGELPSLSARGALATECVGWAIATVSQRAAAFRLHLCYLTLKSMDAPKGKDAYCAAVEPAKMPLLEHFCGRPGLSAWVGAFGYNEYEYKHQRAEWEGPDGHGLETPGLDYLVALRALED